MKADSELIDLIYTASVQAFADWRKANPSERVFAFALSTIDDAIYVNASLNSDESHQRRLTERGIDASSAYGLDTKWGPWEWENEYTGQTHFSPVDERLKQMYEKYSAEDNFATFRATVFDSMVEALLRLKNNGVISNDGDTSGITMFATVYDSFDAEALHRRSAELLNSPEASKELLAAIGG